MEYYSCESESGKWHLNDETYGEQPNSINQVVQKLQNQNQLVKKKQTMMFTKGEYSYLLQNLTMEYYSCESESGRWHLNDETYGEQPNWYQLSDPIQR